MRDYFISYASEDRAAARELVRALTATGADCFLDVEQIPPGHPEYRKVLVEGILGSECIIVLLSVHSQASNEVFREAQVAHDHHRRLIGLWRDGRGEFTNATLQLLLTSSQNIEWGASSAVEVAARIRATVTVSELRRQLTDYQSIVDRLEIDLSALFAAFDRGELNTVVADVQRAAVQIGRGLWHEYNLPGEAPINLGDILLGCRDHLEHESLIISMSTIATITEKTKLRSPTMEDATRATEQLMSLLSTLRARRWGMRDLSPQLRRDAAFLSGLLLEVGWLQGSELVARSDVVYLLFEKPGRDTRRFLEVILGANETAIAPIIDESSGQIISKPPTEVTTRFLVATEAVPPTNTSILSPIDFVTRFTRLRPMADLWSPEKPAGADTLASLLSAGSPNVLYYGQPGTGKSSALRRLARDGWDGSPAIRFFVDYAAAENRQSSTALEDQLADRFPDDIRPRVREIVSYLVRTGRAALILDSIECATQINQPRTVAQTFARLCAFLSAESVVVMAGRDAALRDSPTVREFFIGEPAISDTLSQTLRSTGVDAARLPRLQLERARRRPRWQVTSPRDKLIATLSRDIWAADETRASNALHATIDVQKLLLDDERTPRPLSRRTVESIAIGATGPLGAALDIPGTAVTDVAPERVLRELRAALDYVRTCAHFVNADRWSDITVGETTRRIIRLLALGLPLATVRKSPLALVGPADSLQAVTVGPVVPLAETVVTAGEFREFLRALPDLPSLDGLSPNLPDEGVLLPLHDRVPPGLYRERKLAEMPAVGVSWWAADSFARWSGSRLPTSLEWEIAGRSWDGRIFPWGDDPKPGVANCADHAAGRPILDYAMWRTAMRAGEIDPRSSHAVTAADPANVSQGGQRDLSGNVWEWVSTDLGKHRVIAGGSYDNPLRACVMSSRSVAAPETRSNAVGFRIIAQ